MLGNSYPTAGGPLSQSHVQAVNNLSSMGMLNDVNSNDSLPFDINDFPQLSSRPSSAGGPQGQLGKFKNYIRLLVLMSVAMIFPIDFSFFNFFIVFNEMLLLLIYIHTYEYTLIITRTHTVTHIIYFSNGTAIATGKWEGNFMQ